MAKLLLNGSHLDPQYMRPQRHHTTLAMLKWFYDTSTSTATRAARCGSLFVKALFS
jgi:hypothetical protein